MPTAFLMQQMAWRESLDDVRDTRDLGALEKLDATLRAARKTELDAIAGLLDNGRFEDAGQGVRQLMFLEKFGEEIARAFEILEA